MLSYLVYISFRSENCTEEEIQNILKACQSNNKSKDITGVLMYSDKKFVQYLEGEYDTILELFNKIKTDKRHFNVIMLTSFPIKQRAFPSWQMGSKKMDLENLDYLTNISPDDKKEFQNILSGKASNNAINVIKRLF